MLGFNFLAHWNEVASLRTRSIGGPELCEEHGGTSFAD